VNAASAQPGLFGKLPSHRDFVHRRLARAFLDPWDGWLQGAVRRSREQYGDDWLEVYLTSPLWRFALAPGVCGDLPWAGVLMPSVDGVGRYFPLTLACPLAAGCNPLAAMADADAWFVALEDLALSALEDGFDLESFDARLLALGTPPVDAVAADLGGTGPGRHNAWRLGLDGPGQIPVLYPVLARRLLRELFFAYSLWWTRGSERIAASLLVCQGLPPLDGFSALLAGDWEARGWLDSGTAPAGQQGDRG
jgi:type VI secretion system protein ImpM